MNAPASETAATPPPAIAITGVGAVSPAGWGTDPLIHAIEANATPPAQAVARAPRQRPLRQRLVPPPPTRPTWLAHPRLRRASAISHYAVASALEALSQANLAPQTPSFPRRLAIVVCVMSGSVIYSRRFFDEVLKSPSTASPVLFPETVYNAPASHLAAVLGTDGRNYTLVGDPSAFVSALGLAAGWLARDDVDAALIVGVEEPDWLTAEAWDLFAAGTPASGGSGAILLQRATPDSAVRLHAVTDRKTYTTQHTRERAIRTARQELEQLRPISGSSVLVDSRSGAARYDADERAVWADWQATVVSPKCVLGEGFAAGSAWQCVVAAEAIRRRSATDAWISVAGLNEAAVTASLEARP